MDKKSQKKPQRSERRVKFITDVEEDDLSEEECSTFEKKSEEEKLNLSRSKVTQISECESLNYDSKDSIRRNTSGEKPDSSRQSVQRTVSPKVVERVNNEGGDPASTQPDSLSSKSACSSSTHSLKATSESLSLKKTTKALNLNFEISDDCCINVNSLTRYVFMGMLYLHWVIKHDREFC